MAGQISLNRMPAPTWNRLGVNGALIDAKSFGGAGFAVPEEFRAVATGMGSEAAKLIAGSCTEHRFIEVRDGEILTEPVIAGRRLGDGERESSVTLIHAGKNSSVTVLEFCESIEGHTAERADLTYVIAEEGAKVHVVQAEMLSETSSYMSDTGIIARENAEVRLSQVYLGGRSVYSGCETGLSGNRSVFRLDTAYLGERDRVLDMNYVVRQKGRDTESFLTASGALMGKSDKIYRGTLDFQKGAAGSKGREEENVLILSDSAKNRSVPVILCSEEDVDGQHAATIGRIDKDRLFYLMSRALSEERAKKLIISSGLMPVIKAIPDEGVRNAAVNYLERRLSLD